MFGGDRPCTETTAGDFSRYYTYSRVGATLRVFESSGLVATVAIRSINGNAGVFSYNAMPDLSMFRTAPGSPLCTDSTRTPR